MDTPVCRLFIEGRCKQGKRCRYRHATQEQAPEPVPRRYRPFLDVSKSAEGKALFALNRQRFGEGEFLGCLSRATSIRTQELLRFVRKYQFGCEVPEGELLDVLNKEVTLRLRWSPTVPRSELCLNYDIEEGSIVLAVIVPETVPDTPCRFEVLNESISSKHEWNTLINRVVR